MHLSILLIAVGLAMLVRLSWVRPKGTWADRWQQTLSAFLFPPMLMMMTSITVLGMGHYGTMLWQPVGWIGCHIALGVLAFAGMSLVYLLWQQWRSWRQVRSYPPIRVAGRTARVLETPALFAAQIGIWNPELVVSDGLLQVLEAEQIEAVLSHEEGHYHYRDTFWFFWLSWIRQFTFWLPKTEALWQEILLLRELRADHWASQHVDALVLAESLLSVVKFSSVVLSSDCAAFHDVGSRNRLEERIEFLITQSEVSAENWQIYLWLAPVFIPILAVPFHI